MRGYRRDSLAVSRSTGPLRCLVSKRKSVWLRAFDPPRGVFGPFGPKVGNGVENEFPGPSGPGVQKVKIRRSESKKSQKVEKGLKFYFFDSDFNFFGPRGRKAQGTHFQFRFQP